MATALEEAKILEEEKKKGNQLGSVLLKPSETAGNTGGQLVFGERDPLTGTRKETFSPYTNKTVDSSPDEFNSNKSVLNSNVLGGNDKSVLGQGSNIKTSALDSSGKITTQPIGGGSSYDRLEEMFNSDEYKQKDSLSPEQQKAYDDSLAAEIKNIELESEENIRDIQQKGKMRLGATKSFLANTGIIGRTISGAPLDTNIGILSTQQNLIDAALTEEYKNRDNKIEAARAGNQKAIQDKIDALNTLAQKNFDNAFKLIQEDRMIRSEDRQDRLATLQEEKLNFDINKLNNDINKENIEDTLETIKRMAESGIPLSEVSVDEINNLELTANLPSGSFEAYYQSLSDAKQISNRENLAKVKKAENDIIEGFTLSQGQARYEVNPETGLYEKVGYNPKTYAPKGGGDDSDLTDEEKAFEKDRKSAVTKLAGGESWAKVYDTILGVYGQTSPELFNRLSEEEIKAAGGDPSVDETYMDVILDKKKYYKQTGKKSSSSNNNDEDTSFLD